MQKTRKKVKKAGSLKVRQDPHRDTNAATLVQASNAGNTGYYDTAEAAVINTFMGPQTRDSNDRLTLKYLILKRDASGKIPGADNNKVLAVRSFFEVLSGLHGVNRNFRDKWNPGNDITRAIWARSPQNILKWIWSQLTNDQKQEVIVNLTTSLNYRQQEANQVAARIQRPLQSMPDGDGFGKRIRTDLANKFTAKRGDAEQVVRDVNHYLTRDGLAPLTPHDAPGSEITSNAPHLPKYDGFWHTNRGRSVLRAEARTTAQTHDDFRQLIRNSLTVLVGWIVDDARAQRAAAAAAAAEAEPAQGEARGGRKSRKSNRQKRYRKQRKTRRA